MITEEMRRSRPHEVHARGARQPSWSEDQDQAKNVPGPARTVHRLRRIRQVSVQAIAEIDQALHGAS